MTVSRRNSSFRAAAVWLLATVSYAGPTVRVTNGTYEGLHLPQFGQDIFLGIPYAQDTGRENRFRAPQALNETWNGTRLAQTYSNACPDFQPDADAAYGMGEDCLSINVVRPTGIPENRTLPVAVWIHGGSYQVGTSGLPNYNLTWLVQRSVEIGKPIIATSINYRKGGWGMLYSREIQGSGETNLSLRDMRKALAWISENISGFGGDKNSVTIWGESAGSFAVGQLVISYGGRTDGLFHRSIQESGSAATAWYNGSDWYQPIYDKIVRQTNCTDWPDTLSCLRTVPYETIFPFLDSSKVGGPGFYPTVDGDIIPNYPTELLHSGRFAHIPHIYGSNSDEGTDNAPTKIFNTDQDIYDYLLGSTGYDFPPDVVRKIMELYPDDPAQGIPLNTGEERFAEQGYQYKRAAAIIGDVFYHATRLDDARHYAKYSPTYVYRFNTRPFVNGTNATFTDYIGGLAPAYKGVQHFSEVAFIFGNPQFVGPWEEYKALSEQMSAQWIHFVNGGDPNGEALPKWPKYSEGSKGLNLVIQAQGRGYNGSYVEEDTYRLAGREYLTKWARRRHV
ncbi:alpha/beta-hydrolase [Paraphaeosphaeria sporulosa]|uniref:Carboxylic ester hydrolase n=1 Tax=Paraphaeosphaeria sporulosa TaxID=1460663 RepID=A0A177CTR9_9PLEO|nr:alpha/beta-hydrolase [Paraphaeosphaeria sporulosa]OAG10300.1 alpha/beta-hydrolase [Paraphaeosphaeria sporulosa]